MQSRYDAIPNRCFPKYGFSEQVHTVLCLSLPRVVATCGDGASRRQREMEMSTNGSTRRSSGPWESVRALNPHVDCGVGPYWPFQYRLGLRRSILDGGI